MSKSLEGVRRTSFNGYTYSGLPYAFPPNIPPPRLPPVRSLPPLVYFPGNVNFFSALSFPRSEPMATSSFSAVYYNPPGKGNKGLLCLLKDKLFKKEPLLFWFSCISISETIGWHLDIVPMTRSHTYTYDQGSAAWELETPYRITTMEEKQLPLPPPKKKKRKELLFGPDKETNDHSLSKEKPWISEVGRNKF